MGHINRIYVIGPVPPDLKDRIAAVHASAILNAGGRATAGKPRAAHVGKVVAVRGFRQLSSKEK
jgi:hypothetical protein